MALRFFKKEVTVNPATPSRIKKAPTQELIQWSDTTIMDLGRAFDAWRYHDQPIEDVMTVVGTLQDILQEICVRVANKDGLV